MVTVCLQLHWNISEAANPTSCLQVALNTDVVTRPCNSARPTGSQRETTAVVITLYKKDIRRWKNSVQRENSK